MIRENIQWRICEKMTWGKYTYKQRLVMGRIWEDSSREKPWIDNMYKEFILEGALYL